jgi:hypothetical protein
MILLTRNTINYIYVTPSENTGLVITIFKFIFTNRVTKDVKEIWKTNNSTTNRYQLFSINVDTEFLNLDNGFWDYKIYGCATIGGTPNTPLLESGYMYLQNNTTFAPDKYNGQSNTFVTYNG